MCTVTYLPINNTDFILTSNRDVPYVREKALEPKVYNLEGVELIYPKDGKAGGTWIGTSSNNRLLCLLNGGFVHHVSKSYYRSSRGKIVLDLLKCIDIETELKRINLIDIEPFTLVIVDWNKKLQLMEFVWDGDKKHLKMLPQDLHIWSSSTLYDDKTRALRNDWFEKWSSEQKEYTQDSILKFHKTAGNGNLSQNVLMKREGGGTVSISSIKKEKSKLNFIYNDIVGSAK